MSAKSISDLPLLVSLKVAAEVLGLTLVQMRQLIRNRKIAHVRLGHPMVPRDAIQQFIDENTVPTCPDETVAPGFVFSQSGNVSTSSGQKTVAAGSAQRALRIAERLKSPSQTSSTLETDQVDRVIPLKSL